MFWDVRIDKLLKKGNKRMDDTELVWKPMHVVHLLSVACEGCGRRTTHTDGCQQQQQQQQQAMFPCWLEIR
jgi:hypothetical protein